MFNLREPGREDAETIESGTNAAARGGYTGVACMPNTTPAMTQRQVTAFILERAREVSKCISLPRRSDYLRKPGGNSCRNRRDVSGRHCGYQLMTGGRFKTARIMRRAMEYFEALRHPHQSTTAMIKIWRPAA